MEPKKNRTYTKEFKIEALKLVQQLGSYSAAARQLGISDGTLHAWKDKFNFPSNSPKTKTAEQAVTDSEELKRLRKENDQQKKTIEILRRAAAFFSQDHLK